MQNRLKSKVVWASIVSAVLSILVATGIIDAGQSEAVTAIATTVLSALTVFGILNNPTSGTSF